MSNYSFNKFGIGSNDSVGEQVDPTFSAGRVSVRPLEYNTPNGIAGGHYRVGGRSGALTGVALVAGAPLVSIRWAPANGLSCVITRIKAFFVPTIAFTAVQEIGLDAIHATAFTAPDSLGTVLTPTKMRATMPPSAFSSGDLRIAAATLLTAGTRTLDPNAFIAGGGAANVANLAAGTAYVNPNSGGNLPFGFDFEANPMRQEHPMVLGANEGILIRNTVLFPAAGVATLIFEMTFAEVASY